MSKSMGGGGNCNWVSHSIATVSHSHATCVSFVELPLQLMEKISILPAGQQPLTGS